MEEFLKILTLILISSVKFAFGPSFAYLNQSYDFTWVETNIYSIMGGMIGVTIFMHLSEWIMDIWHRIRLFFFKKKQRKQEIFSTPVTDTEEQIQINYQYVASEMPPRKIFSKRSRRMVKIWKRYGLMGLAGLTPVIFSIPIGTFFMTRLEKNRNKIILYMFISVTCWSLIITTFLQMTHVKNLHEIIK